MWKTVPRNTGYLIRILTMVYCNPYKIEQYTAISCITQPTKVFFVAQMSVKVKLLAEILEKVCLVAGFNPSGKYARQIGILPQIGVKIKSIYSKPPPTWQFFLPSLGWLSDPFKWLSDLQLGYEKVTLNHLVENLYFFKH